MNDSSPSLNAPNAPRLGCVADDVTGATDLSLNLVQGGMRVVQWLDDPPLALAFKSGNFGDEDFFQTALEILG